MAARTPLGCDWRYAFSTLMCLVYDQNIDVHQFSVPGCDCHCFGRLILNSCSKPELIWAWNQCLFSVSPCGQSWPVCQVFS